MARPPLQKSERRNEHLPCVRVTSAEREKIEAKASEAGLTVSEYSRRAILKSRIKPQQGTVNADPALLLELNRIGVNLNQIALKVNAGRSLGLDYPVVMSELKAVLARITNHGA